MTILSGKSYELRRFSTWLFTPTKAMQLYQLMRVGSHFAIAILLTKIGLSTDAIGKYEWMIWIGGLFTTFWVNAFLQTLPFAHANVAPDRQQPLIRLSFVLFSIAGFCLLLILSASQSVTLPLLSGQTNLEGFSWFLLYLAFQLGTYPVEIWFLIKQDGYAIFWLGVSSFLVHIIAFIAPIWLTGSLVAGLQVAASYAFIRWLFAGFLAFRDGAVVGSGTELRTWLYTAVPMLGQAFVAQLIISFDAWMLGYVGIASEGFALFRYASREFPIALSMTTALGISMLPMLSDGWRSGNMKPALAAMKVKTSKLMYVVFPVGIILILIATWLFRYLFNPFFVQAVPIFVVYMLVTGARVLLPTTLLIAKGDTKPILWVSIGELLLKMVTGWFFYQWFGLIGLAWSVVLCSLFEKCSLALYLWRQHHVAPWQYIDLRVYFLLLGCMTCAVVWQLALL